MNELEVALEMLNASEVEALSNMEVTESGDTLKIKFYFVAHPPRGLRFDGFIIEPLDAIRGEALLVVRPRSQYCTLRSVQLGSRTFDGEWVQRAEEVVGSEMLSRIETKLAFAGLRKITRAHYGVDK